MVARDGMSYNHNHGVWGLCRVVQFGPILQLLPIDDHSQLVISSNQCVCGGHREGGSYNQCVWGVTGKGEGGHTIN